ncbi:uncharacterized protein [Elaeis guineensis]|uniref:uncharacterized protein n=1 Tax=Elaeis guineensis var. tenera TaxID=51953 RepID=UPI00094F806C
MEGGGGKGEILLDGEEEENVEIKEEMIQEMMRWLESEINSPTTSGYCQRTPFVTINGNEETCGPSFSDSASTVMASVDTRGVGGVDYFVGWQSDPADVGAAAVAKGVGLSDSGSMLLETAITAAPGGAVVQEEEEEEEWLARVVGGAGFELELEEEENLFVQKVGEK